MEILLQFGFMVTNGLLTLVISWITFKFKKREERLKELQDRKEKEKEENKEEIVAIKEGIVSLLRDRITQSCRYIENNGFITQQQITSITDLYDSYKNLGGNHGLNIIVEKTIKHMEVKKYGNSKYI